ncbi:MAG TPA: tyrosine-type recombinase/integrase [Candidatus Nanoarchaeia archaeon]|nr:tyrosine-type recombinase/integrase [Candidatus Nanoarchaeia archaeon]
MLDFTKKPTTFYFTAMNLKKILLEVVPHPMLLIPLERDELINEVDNYKDKIVGKYITAKQLAYLKVKRETDREPEYLLEKDIVLIEQYFAQYPESRIKQTECLIIKTLVETGCRVSELCDLAIGDIDPDISRVRVIGKGKKWRWIEVNENIIALLRSFKQTFHVGKTPIFKNSYNMDYQPLFLNNDNKPFTPRNIQKFMTLISKKIPSLKHPLHPHLLRHTYAVLQVLNHPEQSIVTLRNKMGHSQVSTTQIYFSMSEPELERLAKQNEKRGGSRNILPEKLSDKEVVKAENKPVEDGVFCMCCGQQIFSKAVFCRYCGGKQ